MENKLANILSDEHRFKKLILESSNIDGYPLVKRAIIGEETIFIKCLPFDNEKLRMLEYLYERHENSDYFHAPVKNRNAFIVAVGDASYIVSKELKVHADYPEPEWWAAALSEIHKTYVPVNMMADQSQLVFEYAKLWNSAQTYMEEDIKIALSTLLGYIQFPVCQNDKCVINHGDPLFSNVMLKGNAPILIDIENFLNVPKEFDIQRHFWDYAIEEKDSTFYRNSWIRFRQAYENSFCMINKVTLINLYVIDVCRTVSWFYLITLDETRPDYDRQMNDLLLFKDALRSKRIETMLNTIMS